MPGHFKDLIEKSNESYDDRISCVIPRISVVWAFEVAEMMELKVLHFGRLDQQPWPLHSRSQSLLRMEL